MQAHFGTFSCQGPVDYSGNNGSGVDRKFNSLVIGWYIYSKYAPTPDFFRNRIRLGLNLLFLSRKGGIILFFL